SNWGTIATRSVRIAEGSLAAAARATSASMSEGSVRPPLTSLNTRPPSWSLATVVEEPAREAFWEPTLPVTNGRRKGYEMPRNCRHGEPTHTHMDGFGGYRTRRPNFPEIENANVTWNAIAGTSSTDVWVASSESESFLRHYDGKDMEGVLDPDRYNDIR